MTECDDRDRPRAARCSHGVGFPATSVDLLRARQPRSARWLLLLLSEMRAQQGRWSGPRLVALLRDDPGPYGYCGRYP